MKKLSSLLLLLLTLSSFTTDMEYQRGDVNQDGSVSIKDVTTLIDYLLTGIWTEDPVIPDDPETETFIVNGVSFTMVHVEGGTFMMGSTDDDSEASNNEKPAHEVTLSSYSIGQTEVTQELWVAVMGSNPSYYCSENGFEENLSRPVENMSWSDCQAFITELNQLTGRTFRLPTEAEWEFAALGGNKSHGYKYSGSEDIDEVAWYFYNTPSQSGQPQSVATKNANELGIYDMSGNVLEWCKDWYGSYSSTAQTNPTGASYGPSRTYRGGSVHGSAKGSRVKTRYYNTSTFSGGSSLGMRLAL